MLVRYSVKLRMSSSVLLLTSLSLAAILCIKYRTVILVCFVI